MKYIFTLFILFYISSHAYGQKIYFCDTTNSWKVINSAVNWPDKTYGLNTYSFKGTVAKSGYIYNILTGGTDSALIREDITQNKVYAIVYSNDYISSTDTGEYLLYDYNLNAGDTFRIDNSVQHTTYTVTKTDTVTIKNSLHKVITLSHSQTSVSFTIVEGIGCLKSPLLPLIGKYFEEDKNLTCFFNRYSNPEIIPAVNNFDNQTSCIDTLLNIPATRVANNIVVYPQPAQNTVTIKLPKEINAGILNLFDNTGRIIKTIQLENTIELEISKPSANSLYFYKIESNKPAINYTGKLFFY